MARHNGRQQHRRGRGATARADEELRERFRDDFLRDVREDARDGHTGDLDLPRDERLEVGGVGYFAETGYPADGWGGAGYGGPMYGGGQRGSPEMGYYGAGEQGGSYTAGGWAGGGYGGGYLGYFRDMGPDGAPWTGSPRTPQEARYGEGFTDLYAERAPRRAGPHAGHGPRNYRRSDRRIEEDVCEALMRDPDVDATEIEVRVADGEVTLSGTVSDRREKRLAEDVVDEVYGVRDVNNELRFPRGE